MDNSRDGSGTAKGEVVEVLEFTHRKCQICAFAGEQPCDSSTQAVMIKEKTPLNQNPLARWSVNAIVQAGWFAFWV